MFARSMFPRDMVAELDRLQRAMQQAFEVGPNIRGLSSSYPAINIGHTPKAVNVYVFAPGMQPDGLEVMLEKGVLTISGERTAREASDKLAVHIEERFAGRFRRVVSLPDDADANDVAASYRNGVLHIRIGRVAEAQPRRIAVE